MQRRQARRRPPLHAFVNTRLVKMRASHAVLPAQGPGAAQPTRQAQPSQKWKFYSRRAFFGGASRDTFQECVRCRMCVPCFSRLNVPAHVLYACMMCSWPQRAPIRSAFGFACFTAE